MFTPGLTPRPPQAPGPEQIADVRLAASKMTGATRRAFEAEMTMKYCGGGAIPDFRSRCDKIGESELKAHQS
jgi:hypothetical protein